VTAAYQRNEILNLLVGAVCIVLMSKGLLLHVYHLCLGINMNYGGNILMELEEEKQANFFRI
jgi:hypothetical protein